jgi:hypothetical protein
MAKQRNADVNSNEENTAQNEVATSMENTGNNVEAQPDKKMKTLISGAEFWLFTPEMKDGVQIKEADGEIFRGYFRDILKREKEGPKAATDDNHKIGATLGYVFEQEGTGEKFVIGAGHSVTKAMNMSGFATDKLMQFKFTGQGRTATNQPFNKFEIEMED